MKNTENTGFTVIHRSKFRDNPFHPRSDKNLVNPRAFVAREKRKQSIKTIEK